MQKNATLCTEYEHYLVHMLLFSSWFQFDTNNKCKYSADVFLITNLIISATLPLELL